MTPTTDRAQPTDRAQRQTHSIPGSTTAPTFPSTRALLLAAAFVPIVCLFATILKLHWSWDDGAITAAFSQTWAATGRIALTPASPQVEGFSSLSWFLLLAPAHLLSSNPDVLLVWMKLLAALCFGASLAVFFRVANRFLDATWQAALVVSLFAFTITPFHETYNGMEMNLSVLALLVLLDLFTSGLKPARLLALGSVTTAVLLATRFESPYMLAALVLGALLTRFVPRNHADDAISVPTVPVLAIFSLIAALLFGLIELWRHHTFGLWMPNTVYAKLWAPYRPAPTLTGFLLNRAEATSEILITLFAPLAVLAYLLVQKLQSRRFSDTGEGLPQNADGPAPNTSISPILLTLSVAAVLFGLLFGYNLGHRGRMIESLLPALILTLLQIFRRLAGSEAQIQTAFLAAGALQLLVWIVFAGKLMLHGDGVPIARYAPEGLAADQIRTDLGLPELSAMIPDVGGAGLCCQHLRILDSALLTSPYLAHFGYTHFPEFFHHERPDVVETHTQWADAAHLYTSNLLQGYSIVAAQGQRLFVRDDLYHELLRLHRGTEHTVADTPACLGQYPADQAFSRLWQTCLVLDRETERKSAAAQAVPHLPSL